VLVVEDESRDAEWLSEMLRDAGYAVEVAASGAEAIEACRRRAFAAILLDLVLPDMSGWDALCEIRAAGLNIVVPTIVVSVSAEDHKGAAFLVHDILAKPVDGAAVLASLRRAGVTPSGPRPIVVIDDDPATLKLIAATLVERGYEVVCFAEAEAALEAAASDPPGVIVLDLLLPGMSGFEFLHRLRGTEAGLHVPVVVWTVKDLTHEERLYLRASANAVVQKCERGTAALLDELRPFLGRPSRAARPRAGREEPSGR